MMLATEYHRWSTCTCVYVCEFACIRDIHVCLCLHVIIITHIGYTGSNCVCVVILMVFWSTGVMENSYINLEFHLLRTVSTLRMCWVGVYICSVPVRVCVWSIHRQNKHELGIALVYLSIPKQSLTRVCFACGSIMVLVH